MTTASTSGGERGHALRAVDILLAVTLTASLAELLLLRSTTRIVVHIPDIEAVAGPYRLVAAAGEYAFYLSAVSITAWLVVAAVQASRQAAASSTLVAVSVGLFLCIAGAGRIGIVDRVLVDAVTCGAVAVLAGFAAGRGTMPFAAGMLAFGFAFVTLGMSSIVDTSAMVSSAGLRSIAEAVILGAGVAAPWMFGLPLTRRMGVAWALAGAVLFLMLVTPSGSSVRILLLWNEGLSGSLAPALYAAAGGGLAVCLAGLGRARRLSEFAGLLLLLAGGVGLHSTQQSALVLGGLLLLGLSYQRAPSTGAVEAIGGDASPLGERPPVYAGRERATGGERPSASRQPS